MKQIIIGIAVLLSSLFSFAQKKHLTGGVLSSDSSYINVTTPPTTRYVDYFFGNSETVGYGLPNTNDAWPYLTAYRMGDSAVNLAVTGWTLQNTGWAGATGYLLQDSTAIPTFGATSKFIFTAIGVNDHRYVHAGFDTASFRAAYNLWAIAILRKGWPANRVILVSPFYIENLTYYNDSVTYSFASKSSQAINQQFGAVVQSVASNNGFKFVDGYGAIANNGKNDLIQVDSLHMNQYGQRAAASAALAIVDTIRMNAQRLAIDGPISINQLSLQATPIIWSPDRSFPLGVDTTGKLGLIDNAHYNKLMIGGAKYNDDPGNLIVNGRSKMYALYTNSYVPVPTNGTGIYMSNYSAGSNSFITSHNWGASSNTNLSIQGYGGQVALGSLSFTSDGALVSSPGLANFAGMFVTGSASPTTGAGILFKYTSNAGYIYATNVGVSAQPMFVGFGGSPVIIQGSTNDGIHGLQVNTTSKFFSTVGIKVNAATTSQLKIGAGTTLIAPLTFDTSSNVLTTSAKPGNWEMFNDSAYFTGYNGTRYNLNFPITKSAKDSSRFPANTLYVDRAVANGVSGSVTAIGTFSGSSQTNGASISGNTITFGPPSATNPGLGFAGNVLPTAAAVTNIASVSADSSSYTLNGNEVTTRLSGLVTATSAANGQWNVTVPVTNTTWATNPFCGSGSWRDATTGVVTPIIANFTSATQVVIQTVFPTTNSGSYVIIIQYDAL